MVSEVAYQDFVQQMKDYCWSKGSNGNLLSKTNLLKMFLWDVFDQTKHAIDGIDETIGDMDPRQRESEFIEHQNIFDKENFDKRILSQNVEDFVRFLTLQVRAKIKKIYRNTQEFVPPSYLIDMDVISKELISECVLYRSFDQKAFALMCKATQEMNIE